MSDSMNEFFPSIVTFSGKKEYVKLLKEGWVPLAAVAALYEDPTYQERRKEIGGEDGFFTLLSQFREGEKGEKLKLAYDLLKSKEEVDLATIVTRQASYEQQIVELVANGIDIMNPEKKIGKFGIGAFSAFPREDGEKLRIRSKTGLHVEIKKVKDKYFFRYIPELERKTIQQGTTVTVEINDFGRKQVAFLEELESRFRFSSYPVTVRVNGKERQIGRGDSTIQTPVVVEMTEQGYSVIDQGSGITEETFVDTFIQSMVSGTRKEREKEHQPWEVRHLVCLEAEAPQLVIQSGDITIATSPLSGNHREHIVVQLPHIVQLDVSRTAVTVDTMMLEDLEKSIEGENDPDALLKYGYVASYFHRLLKADTNEYTITQRIFSKVADRLTVTGATMIPDYPGSEYFIVEDDSIVVPVEVYEKKKLGTRWTGSTSTEWQSRYPLYLTDLKGKGVIRIGNTIYADKETFEGLLRLGAEGRTLFNLCVNPVDTNYNSTATLQGETRGESVGKLVVKEKKAATVGPEGTVLPEAIPVNTPDQPQTVLTDKQKGLFVQYAREILTGDFKNIYSFTQLGFPELQEVLEKNNITLRELLDKILPEDREPPEDWSSPISSLFEHPQLQEVLDQNNITLSELLDKILPEDGDPPEGWSAPISSLFQHPQLQALLDQDNITLSDLLDRILPKGKEPPGGWYFPISTLFEHPELKEVLDQDNITLSDLLDRILPKGKDLPEYWHHPIYSLFEHPQLQEVLEKNNDMLSELLDRILPIGKDLPEYWYYPILSLFKHPQLKEVLDQNNITLSELLDKILPKGKKPPRNWSSPISSLFKHPQLQEVLKKNKITLSDLLDRILPKGKEPPDDWSAPISSLFEHPELKEVLDQNNITLSDLLNRILPDEGEPPDDWSAPISSLFEHPQLQEVLEKNNDMLSELLDRILPKGKDLPQYWYHPISSLFQHPQLKEVLKKNKITLSDLLDRILPDEGEPPDDWSAPIFSLFKHPNLQEILSESNFQLNELLDKMLQLKSEHFSNHHPIEYLLLHPDVETIVQEQAIRIGPLLVALTKQEKDRADDISKGRYLGTVSRFSNQLTLFEESFVVRNLTDSLPTVSIEGLELGTSTFSDHLAWRVMNRGTDTPPASITDVYADLVTNDMLKQRLNTVENSLQQLYGYELALYYQDHGIEINPDVLLAFIQTPYARLVLEDLLECRESELTQSILKVLTEVQVGTIPELLEPNENITISLSDLYASRAQVEGKEENELIAFLDALSSEHNARPRQELQTALSGQTPRSDTWIRELLQNASDEAKLTGNSLLEITTGIDSQGRATFQIEDSGRGMNTVDIFTKLLIPLRHDPEKRQSLLAEGGIGWGLFTVFSVADEVDIVTTKDQVQTKLRLKVLRNEDGEIDDILVVHHKTADTPKANGSLFQVHLPLSGLPQMDIVAMHAALELYGKPLQQMQTKYGQHVQLIVNGKQQQAPEVIHLGTVETTYGKLIVSVTNRDEDSYERTQKRKLYLGDPQEDGILAHIPQSIKDFYTQNDFLLQIDLPENLLAVMSRTGIAIDAGTRAQLQHTIVQILLHDMAKRVVTGKKYLPMVPDDFLTKNPERYGIFTERQTFTFISRLIDNKPLSSNEYEQLEQSQVLIRVIDGFPVQFTEEEIHSGKDPFVETLIPNQSYTVAQIRRLIQQSNIATGIAGEQKKIASAIVLTEEAIRAGTAILDINNNEHLRSIVEWMNAIKAELLPGCPLDIKLANPQTIGSTVWGHGLLGMPFGKQWINTVSETPRGEWPSKIQHLFFDIYIHELTHYVEDMIQQGNVDTLQPLLQLLSNRDDDISADEARRIVAISERRPWSHTSSEETGFGKIYKGLTQLLLRYIANRRVVFTGSSG